MSDFVKKFTHLIIGTLSCFDRVIFKGHLPFGGDAHLNSFVDHVLGIRRKDFIPMLEELSHKLVERAKADGRWAAAYDAPSAATVPDDLQRALDADPAPATLMSSVIHSPEPATARPAPTSTRPVLRCQRGRRLRNLAENWKAPKTA